MFRSMIAMEKTGSPAVPGPNGGAASSQAIIMEEFLQSSFICAQFLPKKALKQ